MRSLAHFGLLVWLCGLAPSSARGDVLPPRPDGIRVAACPTIGDDPIRDRLPLAGSMSRPPKDFGAIPPWGGTIARVEESQEIRPLAFASIDCGKILPESEARRSFVPKSMAGKTFGEMNWLIVGLIAATLGLGSLAAELARPPRFGLIAYGRRSRQASSWIRRPS